MWVTSLLSFLLVISVVRGERTSLSLVVIPAVVATVASLVATVCPRAVAPISLAVMLPFPGLVLPVPGLSCTLTSIFLVLLSTLFLNGLAPGILSRFEHFVKLFVFVGKEFGSVSSLLGHPGQCFVSARHDCELVVSPLAVG